ncbi:MULTISPECIES: DUF4474 domain-containing protein [Clostridium]|uniref:DUF4474 domain-containing protein n=1 Tax=Clostridium cibarium TaxID=2762247 RepID=A0ABR8PZ35_9CLOT|nr:MULTISPECIES: DUF4474 domain-containing protein [Clostridium]MBD7913436.1 DUF4474 domain-containing protein [Clostridium cibarium]
MFEGLNLQIIKESWFPISLILILVILIIFEFEICELMANVIARVKEKFRKLFMKKGTSSEIFNKVIELAGYSYDSKQDIFYYNMDVWQRSMGYCKLYDESTTPLGMVIDCEPIPFEYRGENWLIEFWKGQYGVATGCEIGVYKMKNHDIDVPGVYKGPFYECVSDEDRLQMSVVLIKDGKKVFNRSEKHWWLTGFKLGMFSEPSELKMHIKINLKDREMCYKFVNGLKKAGYTNSEIIVKKKNTVILKFDRPHTAQPVSRTQEIERREQRKNQWLCNEYNELTGSYNSMEEKMKAVSEEFPEMFNDIINIGNIKGIFKIYDKIRSYID